MINLLLLATKCCSYCTEGLGGYDMELIEEEVSRGRSDNCPAPAAVNPTE